MEDDNRICIMCEEDTCNYIKILDGYICKKCEGDMVSIDPGDIKYEYYQIMLKKMWRNFLVSI